MNESQAKQLGRLITSRRMQRGLSVRGLGRESGLSAASIARLEEGRYSRPGADRLIAIAGVLGIDPEEMNKTTGGYLASRLPSTRTYFRAKHGMKHEEIDRLIGDLNIEK